MRCGNLDNRIQFEQQGVPSRLLSQEISDLLHIIKINLLGCNCTIWSSLTDTHRNQHEYKIWSSVISVVCYSLMALLDRGRYLKTRPCTSIPRKASPLILSPSEALPKPEMLNKGISPDIIFNLENKMVSDMGILHRENGTNKLRHGMTHTTGYSSL